MFIYKYAKKESLDRAIFKSKTLKPSLKTLSHGSFEVKGTGNSYTVNFTFNPLRELVIDCSCKAGKAGIPCYHSASAAPVFKLQVRNLQQKAAA